MIHRIRKSERAPAAQAKEGYDLDAVLRELQTIRRAVDELKRDQLAMRQERLLHDATDGSPDAERLAVAITRAITELSMEVHALRRERLPDAPAAIEELCAAIHGVLGERYFGAQWIMEVQTDPDQTAVRLTNAVERLLGPKPSGKKLSHFLTRSIGAFGPWRLMFYKEGSREGNLFRITDTT